MRSYSTLGQPEAKRIILPSVDLPKTSHPGTKGNGDTSIHEPKDIAQERETKFKPIIRQRQQQVNVSTQSHKQVSTSIPVIDTEILRKIDPVLSQETKTIRQLSSEQTSTNKSVTLGGNEAHNVEGLPLSIRQSLPPINISVSLYSDDPTLRMARINGSIIREGEYLSAGLKLEKITPDGVIFSYQNYRFSVGPK